MFSKFITAGLLATFSTASFAQAVDTQKKVDREQIKIELEANCRAQLAANIKSVKAQLDATEGTESADRDALKITAKRLANPKKNCRTAISAVDILAEQLGDEWIPGGVFLTMGADVSSPASIPVWKGAVSPGGQFLVGTGVLFPMDKNNSPGAQSAALSMYGWHANVHNRAKVASALEGNMALVFPIGFSGKFKSIENMSGSYIGANFDIPFSNSAIKNTSVVFRVFAPVSLDDSRLDEVTLENGKSLTGLADLKAKLGTLISEQRPYIVVVGIGAGGKDPAFQVGLEKMTVHATKYSDK